MRFRLCNLTLLFLVWLPRPVHCDPAASPEKLLPADVYGRIPEASNLRISPDGRRLAYFSREKGKYFIQTARFEDGKLVPVKLLEPGENEFNWFSWVNPERLIISVTKLVRVHGTSYKVPLTTLMAINADGSQLILLAKPEHVLRTLRLRSDDVLSVLPKDPRRILIGEPTRDGRASRVFLLDVYTGEKTLVLDPKKGEQMDDWYADREGVVRVGYGRDRKGRRMLLVRAHADDPWMPLHKNELFEDGRFRLLSFGEEPDIFYVTASHINGRSALFRFNVKSGSLAGKVYEHPEVDLDSVMFSLRTGKPQAVTYILDKPETHFLDDDFARMKTAIDKALPGTTNMIVSRSPDERFMIVKATGPQDPGTYYIYDSDAHRLSGFAYLYPQLSAKNLAPMTRVTYKARDSLDIPAYLTLPVGATADDGPFPAVILPHGGPHARDWIRFDFLVQFLASRGYAVLQPNFRGSTGYGDRYEALGNGGWGRAMQEDVTDGTRWLIEQKIADPARICIVGMSYGGYATLMGLIEEPDLYQCGAAFAPVTDIKRLLKDIGSYRTNKWNYVQIAGGLSKKELDRISPIRRYKDITRPLLLVHGSNDEVVPIAHSKKLMKKLKRSKADVRFVELEDGTHHLAREENRIRWLSELETFLGRHLGGAVKSDRRLVGPAAAESRGT